MYLTLSLASSKLSATKYTGWNSVMGYFCRLVFSGSNGWSWGLSVKQYCVKTEKEGLSLDHVHAQICLARLQVIPLWSKPPAVRTNRHPNEELLAAVRGVVMDDRQMVHPITGHAWFESARPFPNCFKGWLASPDGSCVTNHLKSASGCRRANLTRFCPMIYFSSMLTDKNTYYANVRSID